MEKAGKKPLKKIWIITGSIQYQVESLLNQHSPNPTVFDGLVVDFALKPEIAGLCKKLGLNYMAISPDEEKTAKLKKKLKFPDRFCTGISY